MQNLSNLLVLSFPYDTQMKGKKSIGDSYRKKLDISSVTVYSHIMSNNEKLLGRAKNNPKNLSFADFESVMKKCGWRKVHQKGSHHIWCSPFGFRLSIQPMKDEKAKSYQVKQFCNRHEKENHFS